MKGASILAFAVSTTIAISIIDFDTCSLPYIIPLSLQSSCDRSDQWLAPELTTDADGNPVIGITPPSNVTAAGISTRPIIWTHEPFCVESEEARMGFCVYTNTRFANGRGLSVVATPKEMLALVEGVSLFALPNDSPAFSDLDGMSDKQYELEIPDKGRGVIANSTLNRGDYIAGYLPIMLFQDDMMQLAKVAHQDLLIKIAVERLPKQSRDLFNSQHGQFAGNSYVSKIKTNAFQAYIGNAKDHFWAILPESARYNHDCRPNTAYYFDRSTMTHRIHAVDKINPGEEISVAYLDLYMKTEERKKILNNNWGFDCSCSKCMASRVLQGISDHRITIMEQLVEQLNDISSNRTATPATALSLVDLFEQEHLRGPIGDAYMYVTLEYSYLGDKNNAMIWAAKALEGLYLLRGEEHEYFQAMWALSEDIESHRSWRYIANGFKTQDGSPIQSGEQGLKVKVHGWESVSSAD